MFTYLSKFHRQQKTLLDRYFYSCLRSPYYLAGLSRANQLDHSPQLCTKVVQQYLPVH
ncbi:MAG TPA: hypothetical protein VE944_00855 [Nostoc sp.]|uniref:hypothetical protein n=1 Tax=Nostoc sp. TaxID=1180 RepID=UPI002D73FE0E|nr:hypothetical protein [Nostoc sp.]HYX12921.1 hypothetical protein [Nostoc sp.]